MKVENKDDLIKYRLGRAWETYDDAVLLFNNKSFFSAMNRLYYSAYYIVLALFLKENIIAKTHSGVRQSFGQKFIITNKIETENAKIFTKLFEYRQKSDYDDYPEITNEVLEYYIPKTKKFILEIQKFVNH